MNMNAVKRLALTVLMLAVLCLPVCGLAETITYTDFERDYAAGSYHNFTIWDFNLPETELKFLQDKFVRDWDGDGAIEADECNENVSVEWSGITFDEQEDEFLVITFDDGHMDIGYPHGYVYNMPASADGKTVTMTLTNTNGDRFIQKSKLKFNGIDFGKPTLETEAVGAKMKVFDGMYHLSAPVDAQVTVVSSATFDYDGDYVMKHNWTLHKWSENIHNKVTTTDGRFTFAMEDYDVLDVEVEITEPDGTYLASSNYNISLGIPISKIELTSDANIGIGRFIGPFLNYGMEQIFLIDYNDDGKITAAELNENVTCTLTAGKGISFTEKELTFTEAVYDGELEIDCPLFRYVATSEAAEGEKITFTARNTWGDKVDYVLTVHLGDLVHKKPTFTINSEAVKVTEDELGWYYLEVEEGSDLTVTLNDTARGDSAGLEYEWWLANSDDGCYTTKDPLSTAKSYTFQNIQSGFDYEWCVKTKESDNWNVFYLLVDVIKKPVEPTKEQIKVEYTEGIPAAAVSEDLKANTELNTAAKIEAKMEETIVEKAEKVFSNVTADTPVEIPAEQTAVYEVTLMHTSDGGKTWEKADEEHWPESGKLTVVLPYPEGTNQEYTKFVVAHMFTQTTDDHKAGDIEYPAVTNTAEGIRFEVTGLSPIALAWTYEPVYEAKQTAYEDGMPESAVTPELKKAELGSAKLIQTKLETELIAKALSAGKTIEASQIAMCDVTLNYSEDGGNSWESITMEEWNSDKVVVKLNYPKGTSKNTHEFIVAHMFATGEKAGQIEYLDYVAKADGLYVQVSSMSPFAVAAIKLPSAVPATGDSAMPMLWLLGMLTAGIGCAVMLTKRRQNG